MYSFGDICIGILLGYVLGLIIWTTIPNSKFQDKVHEKYVQNTYRVFNWSTSDQLNSELKKGWKIHKTYNLTNIVLETSY